MTGMIKAGPGIQINKRQTWLDGEDIDIHEISLKGVSNCNINGYMPTYNIETYNAEPGDVLMIDKHGSPSWQKPFSSDVELRNEYPALQTAWETLMEALAEYEMVKKLVCDEKRT